MNAHIEWIIGILRSGVELKEYGDPYEFACTVHICGTHAKIMGAAGLFTRKIWRAINDEFKNHGIKTVEFDRMNSTNKTKVFEVK